jgi:FAD/FMN-containing dehydrogenase
MTTTRPAADRAARLDPAAVQTLSAHWNGQLLQPGDAGYDAARSIWNGMIDKRPALIARCAGVSDGRRAVAFAREHELSISIKGGGHNVAGHAVSEGGLMLDLSLMRAVRVDPQRRTARAEGGATWGDFDRETQAFGLATTGGAVSTTGVAGLTLGGGIGWLVGKHGMCIDNLLSVDLVTADGELVTASVDEHADLFWAVRGGGGNFGVATSFEFRLYPLGQVLAGMVAHPIDQARDVLNFYREFTQTTPDELTTYSALFSDPESGTRLAAIALCYSGDLREGERVIQPVRDFGSPVADLLGTMDYTVWQQAFNPVVPAGRRYYWKANLHDQIADPVIDAIVDQASRPPCAPMFVMFEQYHGAFNRVPSSGTAYPHRDAHYHQVIVGSWDDPADDETGITWTRRLYAATEPHSLRRTFLNFNSIEQAELTERVRSGYGDNLDRLSEIKRRYDPTNLFHENNNIPPAG